MLTIPWMKLFYSRLGGISNLEAFKIIKKVVINIKHYINNPERIINAEYNMFDGIIETRNNLEDVLDTQMIVCCLKACLDVIMRQYDKYFNMEITMEMEEGARSSRAHNIDAEEVMRMYSAAQGNAPNATLNYISAIIRSRKNQIYKFIESREDKKEFITMMRKLAHSYTKSARIYRKKRDEEIMERINAKCEKRDLKEIKKIEKKLRSVDIIIKFRELFPGSDYLVEQEVMAILSGMIIGRKIMHVWKEDGGVKTYLGTIRKLKKNNDYNIDYEMEDGDDETYYITKYSIAADFLIGDLKFM